MFPVTLSPSKGKAKEDRHWHASWWEFYSLLEQPRRPIEWSDSSIIFTAHPTQPLVTARHFSSSKQFTVGLPQQLAATATNYKPPTIISASPGGDWLFAYFPGRESDGVGCVWRKGARIDNWACNNFWPIYPGMGIVGTSWLGTFREWYLDDASMPHRLPFRGPRTPLSNPTLLMVTQDHRIIVWYLRTSAFKILSCSLTQPSMHLEGQQPPVHVIPSGPGGTKLVTHAAVGLGYNESSILIATRSCRYPPTPTHKASQFNNMDLSLPMDLSATEATNSDGEIDWGSWGEDITIALCEIQLQFDGFISSLTSNPLQSLYYPSPGISQLVFACTPPKFIMDPAQSPLLKEAEPGGFYLAVSCLDFGDFTSDPKSELCLYSISRSAESPLAWKAKRVTSRTFTTGVLTFTVPHVTRDSKTGGLYVGISETYGSTPRRTQAKESGVGSISVVSLNDLSDSHEWERSMIMAPIDRLGRGIPVGIAVSPNRNMLCTTFSGAWSTTVCLHSLPPKDRLPMQLHAESQVSFLAPALASAVLLGKSTADLTHALSLPSVSNEDVINTLDRTISILEYEQKGMTEFLALEVLGLCIETYRAKARQAEYDSDRESLNARWKVAHDIVSVAACNQAFDICQEGNVYDLNAVWQLIGLARWLVELLERLMKECIICCDLGEIDSPSEMGDDLFGPGPISPGNTPLLNSPLLMHIVHPVALAGIHRCVVHVKQFHQHLSSVSAKGENAQTARDILNDLVDGSGIDFNILGKVLEDLEQVTGSLSREDLHRSVASCHPTPSLMSHLRNTTQAITNSGALNRPRLFIKPDDLIDGVARLTIDPTKKDNERDIVSKGMLTKQRGYPATCVRCGGKSSPGVDIAPGQNVPTTQMSHRWRLWERRWFIHCICGGLWTSGFSKP